MDATPDVGWVVSCALLLVSGSVYFALLSVLCRFYLTQFLVFLGISSPSPAFFLPSIFHFFYIPPPFFPLKVAWCAGLHVFGLRAHFGCWYYMANSPCPCCIYNAYLCLVVGDHRTRVSRRHRHGHRFC